MIEGIENNPDVWQMLFPDHERRVLARNFTETVSKINGVEVVLSISRRQETAFYLQSLFVLVSNKIDTSASERINSSYCEICPDHNSQELLGHILVGPEEEFVKGRQQMYDLRYQFATTLWQKPSLLSCELINQRNFNSELN